MRQTILCKYIEDVVKDDSKGLFLITAPTGYGKTYQVAKYIKENYKTKTIVFIANQTKFIEEAQKQLYSLLDESETEDVKRKTILFKSIIETFKEAFLKQSICDDFFENNENRETVQKMKGLVEALNNDKYKEDLKQLLHSEFHKTEAELRGLIKKFISTKDVLPQWIINLYPSANIENYKIIFMTTKKFFYPLDPLRGKSFYLFERKINDAVIFIDEIDSTKRELLDVIIGKESDDKVDLFRLYRRLDEAIRDDSIYKDYPFDEEASLNYAREPILKIRNYFNEKDDYIYSLDEIKCESGKSALRKAFKTEKFNIDNAFLFNDGNCMTFSSRREKTWLNYEANIDRERIGIVLDTHKSPRNLEVLYEMALDGINYFVSKFAFIIPLYQKYYEVENGKLISTSDVCSSILKRMNLGEENVRFLASALKSRLMNNSRKKINWKDEEEKSFHLIKNDFYYRGFSYLQIVDTIEDHLETQIFWFNFTETPEHYLLYLASNFHVVGLSATATIDSSLVNYDLQYIKHILGERYRVLSEEKCSEIMEDYIDIKKTTYENAEFEIDFIDREYRTKVRKDSKEYLKGSYISDVNFQNHVVSVDSTVNVEDFHLKECGDLYRVLDKFMCNEKLHSFIYFTNSNLNNWGNLTNIIIETITEKYGDKLEFMILDAKKYKNNELSDLLKQSEKVFVVSAYNTIGVGVNLQYYTEESLDDPMKDFDGIFLSEPTNIIPALQDPFVSRVDLIKYLYAIGYLKIRDAIPYKKHRDALDHGFSRYAGRYSRFPLKFDEIDEIGLAKLKVIIQALGRISRTNFIRSHVQIFMTEKIGSIVRNFSSELAKTPLTIELMKVIEYVDSQFEPRPLLFDSNQVKETMVKSRKLIGDFISGKNWEWNKTKMQDWKELREFVLKNPTAISDAQEIVKNCYIRFNEEITEYSVNNGYFISKIANNRSQYRMSISEYSANLKTAMENHYLRESFEDLGYATSFKPGKYIMSPVLFYSIYKAAIGEFVGKLFLKEYGIELSEIDNPEIFELFDYKYGDKVFFDFKNWDINMASKITEYEAIGKIVRKNKKVKGLIIFVINVFFEGYNKISEYTRGDIHIVTIPWLIRNDKSYYKLAISHIMKEIKRYENLNE